MAGELHAWFLERAAELSPALARDLAASGPVWFPEREDHGAAAFLARAVVGQQISAAAARSIWARIEAGTASAGLPLAHFLARADEAVLRGCGLSGKKVRAVLSINAAAGAGALEGLRGLDHAARSERLTRIHGIGPWTCDILALFYLREPDIWPAGDLAVQRVFHAYIGRRKAANAAARFAPWRSLLALHMWRLMALQGK
jgi:DNA-3-methyladenine glycosylase II